MSRGAVTSKIRCSSGTACVKWPAQHVSIHSWIMGVMCVAVPPFHEADSVGHVHSVRRPEGHAHLDVGDLPEEILQVFVGALLQRRPRHASIPVPRWWRRSATALRSSIQCHAMRSSGSGISTFQGVRPGSCIDLPGVTEAASDSPPAKIWCSRHRRSWQHNGLQLLLCMSLMHRIACVLGGETMSAATRYGISEIEKTITEQLCQRKQHHFRDQKQMEITLGSSAPSCEWLPVVFWQIGTSVHSTAEPPVRCGTHLDSSQEVVHAARLPAPRPQRCCSRVKAAAVWCRNEVRSGRPRSRRGKFGYD